MYRGHNLSHMASDEAPLALAQHYYRNLPASKILLIAKILVRRNQHFEPGGLGFIEEIAVFQFLPSTGAGLRDHMALNQETREGARRPIVK